MGWTMRAKVKCGELALSGAVPLPDETEVVVHIAVAPAEDGAAPITEPTQFFGMWADREDMLDGANWVTQERQKWRQRLTPPGS